MRSARGLILIASCVMTWRQRCCAETIQGVVAQRDAAFTAAVAVVRSLHTWRYQSRLASEHAASTHEMDRKLHLVAHKIRNECLASLALVRAETEAKGDSLSPSQLRSPLDDELPQDR